MPPPTIAPATSTALPRPPRPLGAGTLLAAGGLVLLLRVALALDAPTAAEPWIWRWLRVAGEHPVRLGLALLLLERSRPLGRRRGRPIGGPGAPPGQELVGATPKERPFRG